MMTEFEKTYKVVRKRGFKFWLIENRSGAWAWSCSALGDRVGEKPNGALYTRAIGFGDTPNEAMIALRAEMRAKEKGVQITREDFSDLA